MCLCCCTTQDTNQVTGPDRLIASIALVRTRSPQADKHKQTQGQKDRKANGLTHRQTDACTKQKLPNLSVSSGTVIVALLGTILSVLEHSLSIMACVTSSASQSG